jgi:S1-C subfamily serine protease
MTRYSKIIITFIGLTALLFASLNAAPGAAAPVDKKIENLTKVVYPSVVRVEARNGMRKVATGVVIDRDGLIVTTALISPRDEKISVTTSEGKRIEAEFLGMDMETGLALLRAKEKNLPAIALGKGTDLVPGSWVGVVNISPEDTPAVTQGIVSSVSAEKLRLNVWVTPGSSGSPVVDEEGRMIGLLRGIYTEDHPIVFEFKDKEQVGQGLVLSKAEAPSSGLAQAVPVDVVKYVTSEIREKGKVQRGWLGVSIAQDEKGRVEIVGVDEESPAELAKLGEGDIILKIEGKEMTNAQMLATEIRKRKPGQDITLVIERDGKLTDVKAKLGEYPEAEAKRELELRFPRLFPPRAPLPPPRSQSPRALNPERAPRPPLPRKEFFGWEKRKYIGVYLQELNRELSEYFGVKDGQGLLVSKITKDSPAGKAGLRVGDIILKVDGRKIETVVDLTNRIQDMKKGDQIKLDILRDKKPVTLEVSVEEEEREGFFPPESWENALDSLRDSKDALNRQMFDWQDENGKKIRSDMERWNLEIVKKSRDLAQKSKNSAKELKDIYKKWAIKV